MKIKAIERIEVLNAYLKFFSVFRKSLGFSHSLLQLTHLSKMELQNN